MYSFASPHALYWRISLVCFYISKIEAFSSILVRRFCYSVCLSPTGHNSKLIVMKLSQVVEVVSTEVYWFWGQKSTWGQISKIVIFHPIDLKFEQDLYILRHWIGKPTIFEVKRSTQGQTSKIINFQLKNCQFTSD